MTFVTSHVSHKPSHRTRHPVPRKSEISTVSEFDEIQCGSYISQDDSNGEVHFVIRDLEKFRILTEITILPFFRKSKFSRVLHIRGGFAECNSLYLTVTSLKIKNNPFSIIRFWYLDLSEPSFWLCHYKLFFSPP